MTTLPTQSKCGWHKQGLMGVLLVLSLLLFQVSDASAETNAELSIDGTITVGLSGEDCSEDENITVEAGTHVYFCYHLLNTGSKTLRWHSLSDDYFGEWFNQKHYELESHESTYFISDAVAVTENLSVTAEWVSSAREDGKEVKDTASASVHVNSNPATVTVAHFASFADDVDATSVTVRVNGGDAITDFKFGDLAENVELPAGDYTIEILPSGTETVAISGGVTLESGVDYTLAAIGDGANQPLELFALVDDNEPLNDKAKLRITHLAPFADTIEGTAVNICTDDGAAILEGVPYKVFTDPYLELPAGDYDLKIVAAANGCGDAALDLPAVTLKAGMNYDVFAIGDGANQPLQIATTSGLTVAPEPTPEPTPMPTATPEPTPEPDPATVTVAHFAPFADDVDATSVTVRVNGGDAITDFKFGDLAADVELPAGDYTIEIQPSGTDTVAISGDVTLESGVDYTLAAIGDGANQPLELFALVDDNEPLNDKAKLRIAHLAPFADTIEGTAVNICTDDGAAILEGVPYKVFTDPYLELPAGDYDLKIVAAANGCGDAALDLPAVTLEAGMNYDVFAIGDGANQPLQIATTSGLTVAPEPTPEPTPMPTATPEPTPEPDPATVTVAHFASFADDVDATSVTVRVNGGDAITDFKFGDLAEDVELPAGDYTIEILPSGTDTVAISGDVTLESGVDYTLAAIGDGANQPLELFALVDDNMSVNDKAKLRIAHLAPFADTIEGTAVNICTDDGAAILEGVPYKVFTDPYLELPAGDYDLKIVAAANGCGDAALDLPAVTLEAGMNYDVFAIGDGANQPLQIATTSGLTVAPEPTPEPTPMPTATPEPTPEPDPATVTVAHFAPFASPRAATSVTVRANGADLLTDFIFGDIERDVSVPAGDYLIEIVPTGTETVAISANVTLNAGSDYFVAAIGGGSFLPLELFVLEYGDGEPSATATDKGMLRIAHMAPLASALEDTHVDICDEQNNVIVANVPYKTLTAVELAPGSYDLKLSSAGASCSDMLLDIPALTMRVGGEQEVFAVGDGANEQLQTIVSRLETIYIPFTFQ